MLIVDDLKKKTVEDERINETQDHRTVPNKTTLKQTKPKWKIIMIVDEQLLN